MKQVLIKIIKFFTSRMSYFILGLSFSVLVIAVNAAVTINSSSVGSGEMLTSSRWNTMVNDLTGIRDEVNGMSVGFTTCMTKAGLMSSVDREIRYGSVQCDAGWTMTGGGCHISLYDGWQLMRQSYPTGNGWMCGQSYDSRPGTVYVRCCR